MKAELHASSEVTFRIGDVFDPEDPAARWVVTLSLAWNDLQLVNQRLLAGLTGDARPYENFHDAKGVAVAVWEISKYLRDTEDEPAVSALLGSLPAEARADHEQALDATDPASDGSFKRKLATARDMSGHCPETTCSGPTASGYS